MSANRFLIVCGAEKAGTTSLYTYLAAHPAVLPSLRKETDHFRCEAPTLESYRGEFPPELPPRTLHMESSPGYLAEAETVAPRVASSVPQARLVFLLRDPIDRLRSSFRFYKSRLHLPAAMEFEDYVERCLRFDGSEHCARALGLKDWHLRALDRGRYEQLLPSFERRFPAEQILLLAYDELNRDAYAVMQRVCRFVSLDMDFYEHYAFTRENAGFIAQHRGVQAAALFFNDRFERLWRSQPALKHKLLAYYKRLNARTSGTEVQVSERLRQRLHDFYKPTYAFLADRFSPDSISQRAEQSEA